MGSNAGVFFQLAKVVHLSRDVYRVTSIFNITNFDTWHFLGQKEYSFPLQPFLATDAYLWDFCVSSVIISLSGRDVYIKHALKNKK